MKKPVAPDSYFKHHSQKPRKFHLQYLILHLKTECNTEQFQQILISLEVRRLNKLTLKTTKKGGRGGKTTLCHHVSKSLSLNLWCT